MVKQNETASLSPWRVSLSVSGAALRGPTIRVYIPFHVLHAMFTLSYLHSHFRPRQSLMQPCVSTCRLVCNGQNSWDCCINISAFRVPCLPNTMRHLMTYDCDKNWRGQKVGGKMEIVNIALYTLEQTVMVVSFIRLGNNHSHGGNAIETTPRAQGAFFMHKAWCRYYKKNILKIVMIIKNKISAISLREISTTTAT